MVLSRRTVARAALRLLEQGQSSDQVRDLLVQFLKGYNLMTLLPGVISELEVLRREHSEQSKAFITFSSSDAVSTDILERMLQKFSGAPDTPHQIEFDPNLIGGFIVRYGEMIYDYSVKNSLQQLRKHYQLST